VTLRQSAIRTAPIANTADHLRLRNHYKCDEWSLTNTIWAHSCRFAAEWQRLQLWQFQGTPRLSLAQAAVRGAALASGWQIGVLTLSVCAEPVANMKSPAMNHAGKPAGHKKRAKPGTVALKCATTGFAVVSFLVPGLRCVPGALACVLQFATLLPTAANCCHAPHGQCHLLPHASVTMCPLQGDPEASEEHRLVPTQGPLCAARARDPCFYL
jgi:hypothetical protein